MRETVRQWPGRFETVVISVGPFGYLALAEFFSQFWGAQVVLDFRDPLAGENRRPFSSEQRAWLAEYERECVRHADAVISVNQTCLERIAPDVTVDRHSVANGFDERIELAASTPSDRSVHRIVYSGTIFANLPLDRGSTQWIRRSLSWCITGATTPVMVSSALGAARSQAGS